MQFFHAPQSCSMASHIVLEEVGARYTAHPIDLSAGEQHSAAFLAVNPKAKVPALLLDDAIITENFAIQYHLAKAFPEARLIPIHPIEEAHWVSISSFIANSLHVAGGLITVTHHYADDESAHPSLHRKGRAEFARHLRHLDERLVTRTWLMGEQYTTADAYLMPYVAGLTRFGIATDDFPHLLRWAARMISRPAVRLVLEDERSVILDMPELRAAGA